MNKNTSAWVNYLSISIALLFGINTGFSQIMGPTSVCTGVCYSYDFTVTPPNTGMEVDIWEITFNDTTFVLNPDPDNSLTFCFEESGNYEISAISAEGQVMATRVVFARDFTEAELQIVSPTSCSDQRPLQQSCLEVCEGTEVTFEFRDLDVLEVDWWFDGHGEILSSGNDHIRIQFYDGPGPAWMGYVGSVNDHCVFEGGTCVTVVEKKPAGFSTFPEISGDSITLCKGQSIRFENTSTASDVTWFAPGISSAEGDFFTVRFEEEGFFEISQLVGGVCGCDDSKSVFVQVLDAEAAPIYCVGSVCQGDTTKYTTHAGCHPYFWEINGDATIINGGGENDDFVQLVWSGGSVGTVSLSTACSASCFNPTEEIVYILGSDTRIKGPQKVCANETYLFSVPPRDGTTFNWQIRNGLIISGHNTHQIRASFFSAAVDTWVAVEMEDCTRDCRVSDTLLLQRTNPFQVNGPGSVCPGQEVTFEALSMGSPIKAIWEVLDEEGNLVFFQNIPGPVFSFTPDKGGIYTLIAIPEDDHFCLSEVSRLLWVPDSFSENPEIDGEDGVCIDNWYEYSTAIPTGTAIYPEWEITNGSETTSYFTNSVLINWDAGSNNRIRLRWVDMLTGCTGEWTLMEISTLDEIQIIGEDTVCSYSEGIYTLESGAAGRVEWEITDPNSGSILEYPSPNSVRVKWRNPGTAQLQAQFCGLTEVLDVFIRDQPLPELVDQFLCEGETRTMETIGSYEVYKWYEKGVEVCNEPICELRSGSYLLVVEDSLGCIGRDRFELSEIKVPPFQIFNLDPAGICEDDTTRLISTYPYDPDYHFDWYLDGALLLSGTDTLFATDTGNYELVLTHTVTACERRSPVFVVCRFCEDGLVLEDCSLPDRPGPGGGGSGSGDDDIIMVDTEIQEQCNRIRMVANSAALIDSTIIWRICDGSSCIYITGNPASYVFQNTGSQFVTVGGYALDSLGNRVLLRGQLFFIDIFYEIDFNYSLACSMDSVQFDAQVFLNPTDAVASFEWDFGDPTSGAANFSDLENPTHVFSTPGTYDVTLTVMTTSGCELTIEKTIAVLEKPDAYFEMTGLYCTGSLITTSSDNDEAFFSWNFDALNSPGSVDDENNPAGFIYDHPGTYLVALEIEALNGCTDTHTEFITVNEFVGTPEIESPDNFPRCENDFAELLVTGGVFDHYLWSNGSENPTTTAVGNGPFYVTVTDTNGCEATAGPFIPEYLPGPTAKIGGRILGAGSLVRSDTLFVCYGSGVELLAITQEANTEVLWSNGSGSRTLRFDGFERALLSEGVHIFNLQVTNLTGGCTAQAPPFYVVVNPMPNTPLLDSDPSSPLCEGDEIDLFVTNPNASGTYLWNNGAEGMNLTTSDAGIYSVRHINEYGCVAESDPITIHPLPNLSFFPRGCLEICDEALICLPMPPGYSLVGWQVNEISEPLPTDPTKIPVAESGVYTGVFVNSRGCTAESDPIEITIFDGTGDISGMVFGDLDGDLLYSSADTVFENIKIELWRDGVLVDSAFTGSGGSYNFDQKELGAYSIAISEGSIPEGWILSNNFTELILDGCGLLVVSDPLILVNCNEETQTFEIFQCMGDSIEINGVHFLADTVVTFILDGADCEQIEEYILTFYPTSSSGLVSYSACHGDSIEWNGMHFFTDTTLTIIHQNQYGCDSVEQLELNFIPEQLEFVSVLLCPGETYTIDGETFENDTTLLRYIPDGNSGCLVRNEIEIASVNDFSLKASSFPACPETADGYVEIEISPGVNADYFVFNSDTLPPTTLLSNLSAGSYELDVVDLNGCKSSLEWTITEREELDAEMDDLELSCDGNPQWLEVEVNAGIDDQLQILWDNGQTGPQLEVNQAGIYTAEISNQCQSLVLNARAFIADSAEILRHYVPNAFSPNDDGVNDEFKPFFPPDTRLQSYKFAVFDRWGNRVFQAARPEIGWDGIYSNQTSDQAVFVWILQAEMIYCGEVKSIYSFGDVTVMR